MNNKTQTKKSLDLKEYQKNYREKNKEKLKKNSKDYYLKNKKRLDIKHREYQKNKKEKIKKYLKEYAEKNKQKLKEYSRIKQLEYYYKRKLDPIFSIKKRLRDRIRKCIKKSKTIRDKKTLDLLGCSLQEIKNHLEKQFKEGMTWNNYGVNGWHIDHIKPCASFDLSDPEQQKECFHYTNLQPLWWNENLRKGKRTLF